MMNDEREGDLGAGEAAAEMAEMMPRPIVAGIGASAGGIEALKAFFSALPEDLGVAFVVVVHLSPEHPSELASILAACTSMRVEQVRGTLPLQGNHVYVIPPDRRLQITDSELSAVPFEEPRGQRAPIDLFFRSLAEQHGDGFAVVLSGGGSDGAVGVKAIKEAGGLVLVQDPKEAAYDSMPRAAIATEAADVVLPVRELAGRLADLTHTKRRLRRTLERGSESEPESEEVVGRILAHLHARTGHDFSKYKRATVLRRLGRRMQVHRKERLADYLAFLRGNVEEAQALFNDLLISVTTFFRDPPAWEALAQRVIPRIFETTGAERRIRVWVPACATGEEAYSLAILLLEEAQRRELWPDVQVFATDLDEGALATGREGRYPGAIVADVSEERLERFFRREGEHYQVSKEVRNCVLFAAHSLLRNPPFSHLDLVSCRNLLIYLDRELQQQVFQIFRYALRPKGYLFLGTSEVAESRYFQALDGKQRLYRVREAVAGEPAHLPDLLLSMPNPRPAAEHAPPRPSPPAEVLHHRALEELAPPSILVDEQRNAVHLSDSVGRFLQPPGGPVTHEVTRLVRPELQAELRAGLYRAFEHGESTVAPFVPVVINGRRLRVAVLVRPLASGPAAVASERRALVVFLEGGEAAPESPQPPEAAAGASARHLEEELQRTREHLRTSREESEATSEELRSANEELQSIAEEYRSTAEELETNREELQSINEELQTVNVELKLKLEEVSRAHNDLQNLMAATEIGTLFLDRDLQVARFTPSLTDIFNLLPGDRGRPVTDFTHRLDYPHLVADAQLVLEHLAPIEHEVRSTDGRWFLVRLRPYRTLEHRIDGVVATFVDISERQRLLAAAQQARAEAELANQAKSGFMATMSHELRTPLNAVVAYADLLERGVPTPLPESALVHVGKIRLSSRMLAHLIDDMLTFSRIEARREDLALVPLELRPLLEEIEAISRPLAEARGLDFRLSLHEGVPERILSDPRKLRSVLLNLTGNAVKFTVQGEVELAVHANGQEVVFEVRDTGIGIEPEDRERLFEPFWQHDSSLTRIAGGAGLGLAIGYRFVEMLGGSIEVQSRPGEGSVFQVRLPGSGGAGEQRSGGAEG